MKNTIAIIGGIVLFIIVIIALTFGSGALELQYNKWFKPKNEAINREVFENTPSYTRGRIQELASYYEQYNKAGDDDKEAIKSVVKMKFDDFDAGVIPASSSTLRIFLTNMRGF